MRKMSGKGVGTVSGLWERTEMRVRGSGVDTWEGGERELKDVERKEHRMKKAGTESRECCLMESMSRYTNL